MPRLRLTTLLAAGLATSGCSPQQSATCTLTDAADLPVTYTQDHLPVVTVTIAGQSVKMLADSGAAFSFITPAAYARLDLVGTYDVQGRISGVSGDMNAGPFIEQSVTLGHVKLRDDVIMVSDFLGSGHDAKQGIDGLIGEDVLEEFNVGWDLPDNKISLYLKPSCTPSQTPWTGDYDVEPFTLTPEYTPSLPYTIDGQTIQAVLDSGAEATAIQLSDLRQAGITPEAQFSDPHFGGRGINGKVISAKWEKFSSVAIGAEEYSNAWLTVVDSTSKASEKIPSLIGEEFLAHHRVFIANSSSTAFIGLTVPGS